MLHNLESAFDIVHVDQCPWRHLLEGLFCKLLKRKFLMEVINCSWDSSWYCSWFQVKDGAVVMMNERVLFPGVQTFTHWTVCCCDVKTSVRHFCGAPLTSMIKHLPEPSGDGFIGSGEGFLSPGVSCEFHRRMKWNVNSRPLTFSNRRSTVGPLWLIRSLNLGRPMNLPHRASTAVIARV